MAIDDGGLWEVFVENLEEEEHEEWELCTFCGTEAWLRCIAVYAGGACWVIYCGECGKLVQKRWTINP